MWRRVPVTLVHLKMSSKYICGGDGGGGGLTKPTNSYDNTRRWWSTQWGRESHICATSGLILHFTQPEWVDKTNQLPIKYLNYWRGDLQYITPAGEAFWTGSLVSFSYLNGHGWGDFGPWLEILFGAWPIYYYLLITVVIMNKWIAGMHNFSYLNGRGCRDMHSWF